MKTRKLISLLLVLALCLGMAPAALANVEETSEPDIRYIDENNEVVEQFDLREKNYVTPVKCQNPWNSCWAFGGIAAAETSILSMLNKKGVLVDPKDLDLSEKHLTWFAARPITESVNPSQVGEGLYPLGENPAPDYAYDLGGESMYVSTLFSSGVGPVLEADFPYQGAEGLTDVELMEKYPDYGVQIACELNSITEEDEAGLSNLEAGTTVQAALASLDEDSHLARLLDWLYKKSYVKDDDILSYELFTDALYRATLDSLRKKYSGIKEYSKYDDWTIDELDETGFPNRNISAGFTMVDGNRLPDLFVKDDEGSWAALNPDGILTVKSELVNGRAVSASILADQSQPGQQITEDSFINTDTWAQYTHTDGAINHMICIVGWNDNYSKENFNADYMPPRDGAWLAKNSWGSETDVFELEDGTKVGYGAWGVLNEDGKHTGYFWVSYYDKTLSNCSSMSFDIDLIETGGDLDVWSYDYMPAMADVFIQDENVVKTANVFTNETGADARLYAVSTKTAQPNATVTYSIYRLDEDARDPEDGVLLGTAEGTYAYTGFHRESLNGEIVIKPDERIAIVAEETVLDEEGDKCYEYPVTMSPTKESSLENGLSFYFKAVVNAGESFLYENGAWAGWSEEDAIATVREREGYPAELFAIDNFSIKAYVILDSDVKPEPTPLDDDDGGSQSGGSPSPNSQTGHKDGAKTETGATQDGSTITTTTVDGVISELSIALSAAALAAGKPILLPATISVGSSDANAVAIKIALPAGAKTPALVSQMPEVEIPLVGGTAGTVAYRKDADGTLTLIKECRMGSLIVPVSGDCELLIVDNTKTFADVSESDWYAEYVQFVTAREIINGTDQGFMPNSPMFRAMVARVLYNLDRNSDASSVVSFSDVSTGAWYADAVSWAAKEGIVTGYGGAFSPNAAITRQDLATILYRYATKAGYLTTERAALSDYPDAAAVAPYAVEAMSWAVGKGIINGIDGYLSPTTTATRAQVAAIITRFLNTAR